MMEEPFVFVTINIGTHSILLHHFLSLCVVFFPRFYILIFKQKTLKIPSKPREKKRKGICSSCILLGPDDERIFFVII